MLLSELRAQQAQQRNENERNAGTAQEWAHEGVATRFTANSAPFPVQNDEASPPPAYHEAVNDQERMLATYAIRNQNLTRA
ncbi:hypothetical protein J1614_000537 [Plenodomus biglobosus]|nr:hypothetical protein J1614_000537 [Plenodomus biglobosus]